MICSNYFTALDRFTDIWLKYVFSDENALIHDSSVNNNGETASKELLLNLAEVKYFNAHCGLPHQKAAVFSLLFTRFIKNSIVAKELLSDEKTIVTFVTKKGYWLYRVARECIPYIEDCFPPNVYEECREFWSKHVEVKSDRYYTKTLDITTPGMRSNQKIVIVDDIIHTGESIAKFVGALHPIIENALYIVFATYDGAEKELQDHHSDFDISKLIVQEKGLDLGELGELSVEQVILFQALGVPYVIDLPAVTIKQDTFSISPENSKFFFSSGRITIDTFDQICKTCKEKGWELADISFSTSSGWENKGYVFCLTDDKLARKFKNLFQNLVVECTYRKTEEYVDITLIPFSIMRSIRFDELWELFQIVFHGSNYGLSITRFVLEQNEKLSLDVLITALYRSLVFYFSVYTMERFREILSPLGVELHLDTRPLPDHWDENFINDVNNGDLFQNICYSPVIDKLLSLDDIELYYEYWTQKKEPIVLAPSDEKLYFQMYKFFVKARKRDFCSIERLEAIMSQQLKKNIDDVTFRLDITRTMVQMLNQSAICNAVEKDSDSHFVLRGFRPGENCTLILPFDNPAVFCAIYEFSARCEDELTYQKNYGLFQKTILNYISRAHLDTYLNFENTVNLLEYFKNVDPTFHVKNKSYVVHYLTSQNSIDAMLATVLKDLVNKIPLK